MSLYSKKSLVILKKNIIKFFELHFLIMFNSLNHLKKLLCESYSKKVLKSCESHKRKKRVQFFESYCKMGSILWVIFKRKKVQFFESCSKSEFNFYESMLKKKFNSMSHVENGFNSLSDVQKEGFNSLSHVEKEGFNSVSLIKKKGSIQWITVFEKFNSWSQLKKSFNA